MVQKYFEKIDIKKIGFEKPESTYFVFKNNQDSVEVQAASASEAIQKSGIKEPFCVKNISYKLHESSIINDQLKIINSDISNSSSTI